MTRDSRGGDVFRGAKKRGEGAKWGLSGEGAFGLIVADEERGNHSRFHPGHPRVGHPEGGFAGSPRGPDDREKHPLDDGRIRASRIRFRRHDKRIQQKPCQESQNTVCKVLGKLGKESKTWDIKDISLCPPPRLHLVLRHRLDPSASQNCPPTLRQIRSHRPRERVHQIHDQADGVTRQFFRMKTGG